MNGPLVVVGAGAWGTALANAWAQTDGEPVTLLARDERVASAMARARENAARLPGIALSPRLAIGADPACIQDAGIVAFAVPTQRLGEAARSLAPHIPADAVLLGLAKGIERASGRLPHAVLADALPGRMVAALSGPGFAADVAAGLPTAVTVAAPNARVAEELAARLATPALRPYASDDLVGVETGGALKNILALGVGIADGLALGASAKAALTARGFAEMVRLATALGGRAETLSGLSGLGDLVLSCADGSRNFRYGAALARGEDLSGAPLAEGAFTARMAVAAARERDVEVPIMEAVAAVLERTITPRDALARLLARPLRAEG